jgi:transketolase
MSFNQLEKRIIELSYRHQLTHISSCLNCVNLIDWIYGQRKEDEPFVQGNGHAALAHYVVLEKHGMCDAEEMVNKHGTHASRDMEHGIWCSNGSLGQAETVAVGMALADKNRKVWLVTSDGACMEGAVYEALRVASNLSNMITYVVANGFGAYGSIGRHTLPDYRNVIFNNSDGRNYPEFLRGLAGHYLKLNHKQYEELIA